MIINKSFVNVYIREFVTTQMQICFLQTDILFCFSLLENKTCHDLVI